MDKHIRSTPVTYNFTILAHRDVVYCYRQDDNDDDNDASDGTSMMLVMRSGSLASKSSTWSERTWSTWAATREDSLSFIYTYRDTFHIWPVHLKFAPL